MVAKTNKSYLYNSVDTIANNYYSNLEHKYALLWYILNILIIWRSVLVYDNGMMIVFLFY